MLERSYLSALWWHAFLSSLTWFRSLLISVVSNLTGAAQTAAIQNGNNQSEFGAMARGLWDFVCRVRPAGRFMNFEGGSVEQNMNPRLLLRHSLNYAAALTVLRRTLEQVPERDREDASSLYLLELGCGSGLLSAAFSRMMPAHWNLLATDYSPELIRTAQHLYQLPNLRFQRADVRSLNSLNLAGFHAVFFLELIEHLTVEGQRELLTTLHRGMRRGAVVVFSTLDRSGFSRPHSGYRPHQIEYSYLTMDDFLRRPENNRFGEYQIWRLRSARIAADAVRSENHGGYFFNRLTGLVERLIAPHPVFRECSRRLVDAGFRVYSGLSSRAGFRVDEWLSEVLLDNDGIKPDSSDSFGMLVWMRKV